MAKSAHLDIFYLEEGQDSAEEAVNDALDRLDAAVQLTVRDRHIATPPQTPSNGHRYIVASSGTGTWLGRDDDIACYYGQWIFLEPEEGWRCYVQDEECWLVYNGTAWVDAGPVADLTQSITSPPTQAEVQAVQTKVNSLLAELRTVGVLKT